MPDIPLLPRLVKFLRANQAALVADCESVLQMEHHGDDSPKAAFPWKARLNEMVETVAKKLEERGAGAPLVVDDEATEDQFGIQCLLLEASLVRNFFLRALNRFQVLNEGKDGATISDMTAVRQDALTAFDKVTSSNLSAWIAQVQNLGTLGLAEKPRSKAEEGALPRDAVQQVREGLIKAADLVGKARASIPSGRDEHAVAAARLLQQLTSLVDGFAPPQAAQPQPTAAPLRREPLKPSPIRFAPLDVRAFAQSLTETFKPVAEQKGLHFAVSCDPTLNGIETDAPKLHRAMTLLLGNAVRYCERGAVTLIFTGATKSWSIQVEDTGPGIAKPKLDEMLAGDPCASDSMNTQGLGLTVARDVTEMLGGMFHVESAIGKGSKFRVTLPRSSRDMPLAHS